jgi:hypothetical protein
MIDEIVFISVGDKAIMAISFDNKLFFNGQMELISHLFLTGNHRPGCYSLPNLELKKIAQK